jgi:hypothetical protein
MAPISVTNKQHHVTPHISKSLKFAFPYSLRNGKYSLKSLDKLNRDKLKRVIRLTKKKDRSIREKQAELYQQAQSTEDIMEESKKDYIHINVTEELKLKPFLKKEINVTTISVNNHAVEYDSIPPIDLFDQLMAKQVMKTEQKIYTDLQSIYDEFINDIFQDENVMLTDEDENTLQTGGYKTDCDREISQELEFDIPDTLHDFGKERNNLFPTPFSTKLFLEEAKKFLNSHGIISRDYCQRLPGNFERRVTIDYLLGTLCPSSNHDIYYYSDMLSPKYHESFQSYFQKRSPGKISDFFEKLKDYGYKYYVFDAVMSIHKEDEWKTKMTEFRILLCNLWDPAGTMKIIKAEDINKTNETIGILKLNIELGEQIDGGPFRIVNTVCVNGQNARINFDDEVFQKLFQDLDQDSGINVKLRLATNGRIASNKFISGSGEIRVAIIININGVERIFLTTSGGGYSVKELSAALYYIEYGEIPSELTNELKVLVDFVRIELSKKIQQPKDVKLALHKLITRFKSTGDHGTARTTKIINEIIEIPTLYLSGDQLAYMYSISEEILTVFKFYGGKKDADEDDSDDNSITHFIGAYFPEKDPAKCVIRRYKLFLEYFSAFVMEKTKNPIPKIYDGEINEDEYKWFIETSIEEVQLNKKTYSEELLLNKKTFRQDGNIHEKNILLICTNAIRYLTYKVKMLIETKKAGNFNIDIENKLLSYTQDLIDEVLIFEHSDEFLKKKIETEDNVKLNLKPLLNENHPSIYLSSTRTKAKPYFAELLKNFCDKSEKFTSEAIKKDTASQMVSEIKTKIDEAKQNFKKEITKLFGEKTIGLADELIKENDAELNVFIKDMLSEPDKKCGGLSEYLIEALTKPKVGGSKNKRTYRNKTKNSNRAKNVHIKYGNKTRKYV